MKVRKAVFPVAGWAEEAGTYNSSFSCRPTVPCTFVCGGKLQYRDGEQPLLLTYFSGVNPSIYIALITIVLLQVGNIVFSLLGAYAAFLMNNVDKRLMNVGG